MEKMTFSVWYRLLKKGVVVFVLVALMLQGWWSVSSETDPMDGYITGMLFGYSGGNGIGVPGVEVTLKGTTAKAKTDNSNATITLQVTTDENGWYHFRNLPEGSYIVSVTGSPPPSTELVSPPSLGPFTLDHLPGGQSELTRGTSFLFKFPGCQITNSPLCNGAPNELPPLTTICQPPPNATIPQIPPPDPPKPTVPGYARIVIYRGSHGDLALLVPSSAPINQTSAPQDQR